MVNLQVVVNKHLTLDAGSVSNKGENRFVEPPITPMFQQVANYLGSMPIRPLGFSVDATKHAIALVSVCLRYGSYLAVLTDQNKPVQPNRGDGQRISLISDGEMKRINIEASAALAWWVNLYRTDRSNYRELIERALSLLPAPDLTMEKQSGVFFAVAKNSSLSKLVAKLLAGGEYKQRRLEVEQYPNRVFANSLTNYAWRNQDATEDCHAGAVGTPPYPLSYRRISADDTERLLSSAVNGMRDGVLALEHFSRTPGGWVDQVAPYHFAELMLITPHAWSLTDTTSVFTLPGVEAGND